MSPDIEALSEANGGYWGDHPLYPAEDWRLLVFNGESRRGYWEWVEAQLECARDGEEE